MIVGFQYCVNIVLSNIVAMRNVQSHDIRNTITNSENLLCFLDFQYNEGYYFDRRNPTTTRAISYLDFSLPLLILATAQCSVELVFHIVHRASHGAKPRLDGIPDILVALLGSLHT